MKNFRFDMYMYTLCSCTQELFNCACGFIGKSAVIKYHQVLSKVIYIKEQHHVRSNKLISAPIDPIILTWRSSK